MKKEKKGIVICLKCGARGVRKDVFSNQNTVKCPCGNGLRHSKRKPPTPLNKDMKKEPIIVKDSFFEGQRQIDWHLRTYGHLPSECGWLGMPHPCQNTNREEAIRGGTPK